MTIRFALAAAISSLFAAAAFGQITPAAAYTPPDDTPSFKVDATIFADYTYIESPKAADADGNTIHSARVAARRAALADPRRFHPLGDLRRAGLCASARLCALPKEVVALELDALKRVGQ